MKCVFSVTIEVTYNFDLNIYWTPCLVNSYKRLGSSYLHLINCICVNSCDIDCIVYFYSVLFLENIQDSRLLCIYLICKKLYLSFSCSDFVSVYLL